MKAKSLDYSNPALGSRLRAARLKQGWDVQYFARLLDVDGSYVSHIERGYVPNPSIVQRMASFLGLHEDATMLLAGYAPASLSGEHCIGEVLEAKTSLLRTAPAESAEALRWAAGEGREVQLRVSAFLSAACFEVRSQRRSSRRAS